MDGAKKLTKEERLALRWQRVQQRRNAKHAGERFHLGTAKNESGASSSSLSASKGCLMKARQIIDAVKSSAEKEVSDVRLTRQLSEAERRKKEELKRSDRMNRLEKEMKESEVTNEGIEKGWGTLANKKVPQELYAEIAAQYKAAAKLLSGKDELIKSLQQELKEKDEQYVEVLSHHEDDVAKIMTAMTKNFQRLIGESKTQIAEIEQVFTNERKELLDQYRDELYSLFERRRRLEIHIMENRQHREKKFAAELNEIRHRDAEDYNALKIDLETSIQVFEQQLEEMRAVYLLNSEKLEYNHQVLLERDLENRATVEHHRMKLRRLKESLSAMIARFHKQDARFKSENKELTDDYKKMTEQFKDLQRKYLHFESIDTEKYKEVFMMNEEAVMALIKRALKADQIIHEQILGWKWNPPFPIKKNHEGKYLIDSINSAQIFQAADAAAFASLTNNAASVAAITPAIVGSGKYTVDQVSAVMKLIAAEGGYLLDGRTIDAIAAIDDPDERLLFQADTILAALGVEDRDDLEELLAAFYQTNASNEDERSAKGAPFVHPNDVTKVVKEWIVERQSQKTSSSFTSPSSSEIGPIEKKMKKKERERRFWRALSSILDGDRMEIWNALENAQKKYSSLLEQRSKLIAETSEMAKQNEELKVLLQEYLASKINHELHVPPTRIIRLSQ